MTRLAPRDDWRQLAVIDAADAGDHPGLHQIKTRVDLGILPRSAPVLVGVHPLTGGFPDAVVACPIDHATAQAVLQGDPTALADCLEMLADALDQFTDDLARDTLD